MSDLKNETIVDRVVLRLKAAPLGDLITEEDLHDIVKEAIPKVFFSERRATEGSGFNSRTVTKEPVIHEIMRELLRDEAQKACEKWLEDNPYTVAAAWKERLDEGLIKFIDAARNQAFDNAVRDILLKAFANFNSQARERGLPEIFP